MCRRHSSSNRKRSSANWNDRLTCVPSSQQPAVQPTHTSEEKEADVQQWSEAAHRHEKQRSQRQSITTKHTVLQSDVHPKTRVFRWFEHVRRVTGLKPTLLIPHDWTLYTATTTTTATTTKAVASTPSSTCRTSVFCAHAMLHHAAVMFASTEAPVDNHMQMLVCSWVLQAEQVARCISLLCTTDTECVESLFTPPHPHESKPSAHTTHTTHTTTIHQLERLVCILYEDQFRRFEKVKQELAQASVSESSPLHTLFETFSATAQATSVVHEVLFAVWRILDCPHTTTRGRLQHHAESQDDEDSEYESRLPAPDQVPVSSPHQQLQSYFRRMYDDEPRTKILFRGDALYVCTVHQLDGQLLGEATHMHRDVALQKACLEALQTLHVPHKWGPLHPSTYQST